MTMPLPACPTARSRYYRHALPIRIMHWVNVLAFLLLLMSGLQIFNAHPALDWGRSSYSGRPPFLEIQAKETADGRIIGVTRLFGHEFNTTGVLGVSLGSDGRLMQQDCGHAAAGARSHVSLGSDGRLMQQGFPAWATVPGARWLAMGRRWHLFIAWVFVGNGLVFLVYSIASRHLMRDLAPTRLD